MTSELKRVLASVFLLSWTSILLQLSFIRILSVTRWHHFSFFVISTALLGYGVSGVLLTLLAKRISGATGRVVFAMSIATATLGLGAIQLALKLKFDSQFLFQSPDQILLFVLYNLLAVVPFLLAATGIGLPLMRFPEKSSTIYAMSLLGTGAGGVSALAVMFHASEEALPALAMVPALLAAAAWLERRAPARLLVLVLGGGYLALSAVRPPSFFLESHKRLAELRRWAEQGDATHLLTRHSPRGRIDVFESPLLHFTLFAGLKATSAPPPQLSILRDGFGSGTVFKIRSAGEAEILSHVPASVAYRLRPGARALLLGEGGGTSVWLARKHAAREVTVVQPDPLLTEILQGPLAEISGGVLAAGSCRVVSEEPRQFLQGSREAWDVVQLVSAEEMAAESRGAGGLQEDYLLTVEGFRALYRRLSPRGIATVSRGRQVPPRDALKLVATMSAALDAEGVPDPGRHLALLENYLSDTLLLFRAPRSEADDAGLRSAAGELALDIRWPQGMNAAPEKPSGPLPSIGTAVASLLSPEGPRFVSEWIYDVRPPRDERPYFRDFFRFQGLSWMKRVYGDDWYLRLELGFAVLLVSAAEILVLSFLLLFVPIALHARRRIFETRAPVSTAQVWWTFGYFYAIGIGFMGFEIVAISRMTLQLGDPLYAASAALTCLLLGAGAGSLVAGRNLHRPMWLLRRAVLGVYAYGLFLAAILTLGSVLSGGSFATRALLGAAGLFPLSFLLGLFFPTGLHLAQSASEVLVAWAWGVNGFASVAAPALVTMLAMVAGQRWVLGLSLAAYGFAALSATRLARAPGTPALR